MADALSNTEASKLPGTEDYRVIGMDTVTLKLDQVNNLRLFNDMVDTLAQPGDVASLPDLNTLAERARKILSLGAQKAGDTISNADKLLDTDYTAFNIESAYNNDAGKDAIHFALQAKDADALLDYAKVKKLAADAAKAFNQIQTFADTGLSSAAGPTASDYAAVGISGIRDSGKDANLSAIKEVLALTTITKSNIDKPADLQALVDSYNKIFAQANGQAGDATASNQVSLDDLTRLGIVTSRAGEREGEPDSNVTANALKLLNSFFDQNVAESDINTPANLQTYVDAVRKVDDKVRGLGGENLKHTDLTALKINGVNADNIGKVREVLAALADNGSASDTWSKVNDAVFSVTLMPTLNKITGDDLITKTEYDAGVTLSGVAATGSVVTLYFANGTSASVSAPASANKDDPTWNWSYTLSAADWTALLNGTPGNDIQSTIRIDAYHASRNVRSVEATRTVTIDIVKPGQIEERYIKLVSDTGFGPADSPSRSDKITKTGRIEVNADGVETDGSWYYSTDGVNYQRGGGKTTGEFQVSGTDGAKSVWIRLQDKAGNLGDAREFSFTLDNSAPTQPSIDNAGKVTFVGTTYSKSRTITVSNLEANALYEYSLGNDQWTSFTGNSFTLPESADDNKEYRITVRQTDRAGNVSTVSAELRFTLDTKASAPTLELDSPAGSTPSGEYLVSTDSFTLSGVAEKGATVTVKDGNGATVGTATASATDGQWTLAAIRNTLEVRGFRNSDGSSSSANGTYSLLTQEQKWALNPTAVYTDYLQYPAYVLTADTGETWYAFVENDALTQFRVMSSNALQGLNSSISTLVDGFIVTKQSGTGSSATPRWIISDTPGNTLISPDASITLSNNPRGINTYSATQTDIAGNTSTAQSSIKVKLDTTAPLPVDLDPVTNGLQTSASADRLLSNLKTGMSLLNGVNVVAPSDTDIRQLTVHVTRRSSHPDTDELLFGSFVILMSSTLFKNDQTVGSVSGLTLDYNTYKYSIGRNSTDTLILRKSNGTALSSAEIQSILRDIRIRNTASTIRNDERIEAEIQLRDYANHNSRTSTFVNRIDDDSYWLDLSSTAGIQQTATQLVRVPNQWRNGVAVTGDNVVVTRSAKQLELHFSWDRSADQLALFDPSGNTTVALNAVSERSGASVAGIGGLYYRYDSTNATFILRKVDGTQLNAGQLQSILRAIKLKSDDLLFDGKRTIEAKLVNDDYTGSKSTYTLTLDTVAPALDLDKATPGVQNASSKVLNLELARAGTESLFEQTIEVQPANDIKSISLIVAGSGLAPTLDRLVASGIEINLSENRVGSAPVTINGVENVLLSYDAAIKKLEFIKQSGASMTQDEATKLLNSLRFKSTSENEDPRTISITLTDQAGNTSPTATATIKLDKVAAPALTMTLVNDKQVIYQVIELESKYGGTDNPNNLTKNEDVGIPLPSGMTATDFLKAMRGMSAEWGGRSIAAITGVDSGRNRILPQYKTFKTFSLPPTKNGEFSFAHQGGEYVKGGVFKFTSESESSLKLLHTGSYFYAYKDMYSYNGQYPIERGDGYDIGNIKFLYEKNTTINTRTPTLNIAFGEGATIGARISLYDGDTLLASKTITAEDKAARSIRLSVTDTLREGTHNLIAKYQEASGDTSTSNAKSIPVGESAPLPQLSNLKVLLWGAADKDTVDLIRSDGSYASMTNVRPNGRGLSFKGTVSSGALAGDTNSSADEFLITVKMGETILGFRKVAAGPFEVETAENLVAPGFYNDLSITVTNVTANSPSSGQTYTLRNIPLATFMPALELGNTKGGSGNDEILLGKTLAGLSTSIQTGEGHDVLTVGKFGQNGNFAATITDFQLDFDKVRIFDGGYVKLDENNNLSRYLSENAVAPIDGGSGTRLVIDLERNAAGTAVYTYTLDLKNVTYNAANTHTLFGI
ncbi:hypothetical protein J2S30_004743 [Herbaspirillum rubrisubalbicans]|uniref:Ig-like domain-containing protein n=1 Tax=Herbaspirillum rubrisubalbicans TaxID=80842 RepID=UPI0020A19DCF|nr:Ig-like domain-containing protein [Herbaspirillum rubrisubalbicans]MCP1576364.1 hypothetical protein [Herbaspirillum rubrisubalbicans]